MIAVCLKWIDQRPEIGDAALVTAPDPRFGGVSAADQAALEMALRCRDADGEEVVVICAGPAEADRALHDGLAVGATRAIRVDLPFGTSSRVVATALAGQLVDTRLVWCGDQSLDRGTGSVPAFLAVELGFGQALGLVGVDRNDDGTMTVTRRLDGGRREVLRITDHAVLSVEGSTALLRRAPLRALRSAPSIEVVIASTAGTPVSTGVSRPYRPRPRSLPSPAGTTALERVRSLTSAATAVAHGETVTLSPSDAADRILAALREWGYTV